MLFNIRPVRDVPDVKREIYKIVKRQKPGTWDDLSAFSKEVDDLVSSFSEFNPLWKRAPIVFRVARVNSGPQTRIFLENIELPNTKHDIDLVLKMLNHMRTQKGFAEVKQPLFVQPDEISLAHKEGRIDFEADNITSQLAIVFQKGAINLIGFVFGRDFVLLEN